MPVWRDRESSLQARSGLGESRRLVVSEAKVQQDLWIAGALLQRMVVLRNRLPIIPGLKVFVASRQMVRRV